MRIFGRGTRRAVAPVLATLLTSLSVAVPLLDQGDAYRGPVAESEHHPSTCVVGHDHTICTQAGANIALTAEAPRLRRHQSAGGVLLSTVPTHLYATEATDDGRPRAPPLA